MPKPICIASVRYGTDRRVVGRRVVWVFLGPLEVQSYHMGLTMRGDPSSWMAVYFPSDNTIKFPLSKIGRRMDGFALKPRTRPRLSLKWSVTGASRCWMDGVWQSGFTEPWPAALYTPKGVLQPKGELALPKHRLPWKLCHTQTWVCE